MVLWGLHRNAWWRKKLYYNLLKACLNSELVCLDYNYIKRFCVTMQNTVIKNRKEQYTFHVQLIWNFNYFMYPWLQIDANAIGYVCHKFDWKSCWKCTTSFNVSFILNTWNYYVVCKTSLLKDNIVLQLCSCV